MKFNIFIFFILFSFVQKFAAGQDTSKFALVFKFHPLSIFNPDRPSVNGSMELVIKNKIGIEIGYGKRYADRSLINSEQIDTLTVQQSGQTIFFDLTYYTALGEKTYPSGYAFEGRTFFGFSYKNITDLHNDMLYYFNGAIQTTQKAIGDCYAVRRKVHVFTIKGGYLQTYKSLSFELYADIGIRYRFLKLINNEFNLDRGDTFPDGFYSWQNETNGSIWPSFSIGLKLNYKFAKWN